MFKCNNTLILFLVKQPRHAKQSSKKWVHGVPCICGYTYSHETRKLHFRRKEQQYNMQSEIHNQISAKELTYINRSILIIYKIRKLFPFELKIEMIIDPDWEKSKHYQNRKDRCI